MKELEKKNEGCRGGLQEKIRKYEEDKVNNGELGEKKLRCATKIKGQVNQGKQDYPHR